MAKQLKEAGEIIGIALFDYLVLGKNQYFSLNEKGML